MAQQVLNDPTLCAALVGGRAWTVSRRFYPSDRENLSTELAARVATVRGDMFMSAMNRKGVSMTGQADKAGIWSETTQAA